MVQAGPSSLQHYFLESAAHRTYGASACQRSHIETTYGLIRATRVRCLRPCEPSAPGDGSRVSAPWLEQYRSSPIYFASRVQQEAQKATQILRHQQAPHPPDRTQFAYLGGNYNGFEHRANNTTPLPTVEEEVWKAL
ncbi:pseudouridine synthase deg1 [Teratosphaeriaceae sp. CCFEE 6253]|nr:pseudouridine synthase deg1 [Teratosphaeriaceae sp. CCFEE 6253]